MMRTESEIEQKLAFVRCEIARLSDEISFGESNEDNEDRIAELREQETALVNRDMDHPDVGEWLNGEFSPLNDDLDW
jgi:hypothetical protein